MENITTEYKSRKSENTKDGSSEMFQAFMYELFEKNGILNDVRSHLRARLANVLKNVYSEGPLPCKRRFVERIEPTSQAINVLILEYLMRLEFNYSLSVFVSELPLNNMVFNFCKDVKKFATDQDYSGIRFSERDVLSIISYSGLQVDSEHTSHISQMYKENKLPLLLCILQCMPLFKDAKKIDNGSDETLSSSTKSVHSSLEKSKPKHKKRRKDKYTKLQKKYREKKKTSKGLTLDEDVMEDINILEKRMIDEMFSELREVYETEIEHVRAAERDRVKRHVAAYVTRLQEKQQRLEDSYLRRKMELEWSVSQRKRFLCALTRRLAAAVSRAQLDAQERKRAEEKIKVQLQEAEQAIKQRGEELREKISKELLLLLNHLDDIKREKENLNRERKDFENLRDSLSTCKVIRNNLEEQEDWASKYKLLEQELLCIKSYIRSSASQQICPSESASNTNATFSKTSGSLNNAQISEKTSSGFSEERPPSLTRHAQKVVNDLKGRKNVNFKPPSVHEIHRSRTMSPTPASEEGGPTGHSLLLADNEQLREFARQQSAHIEQLRSLHTRLQAELSMARCTIDRLRAPAPAPAPEPFHVTVRRASDNPPPRTCGAGEELSAVPGVTEPRVWAPGDAVPFVGVVGGSQGKRHLMNQWRALRRLSPKAAETNERTEPPESTFPQRNTPQTPVTSRAPAKSAKSEHVEPELSDSTLQNEEIQDDKGESQYHTEKKEQKEVLPIERMEYHLLRNPDDVKCPNNKSKKHGKRCSKKPESPERPSPSTLLREAKQRLKRLTIEADAAEQSYRDFRQRQGSKEESREYYACFGENEREHTSRPQSSHKSLEKCKDTSRKERPAGKETNPYLDAIDRYKPTCEEYFKNRNTIETATRPIPKAYTAINEDNLQQDKSNTYLEKPMPEFRKLYKSTKKSKKLPKTKDKSDTPLVYSAEDKEVEAFVKKRMKELAWPELGTYNLERMNAGDFADPGPADLKIDTDFKDDESRETVEEVDSVTVNNVEVPREVELSLPITTVEKEVGPSKEDLQQQTEIRSESITIKVNQNPRDIDTDNSPKPYIGVKNQSQNLKIVVSSSEVTQTILGKNGQKLHTEMTVVVTPDMGETKVSPPPHSRSPEQEANITRTDVMEAIYNDASEVEPDINESEKEEDEYGDDFHVDDYSAGENNFDMSPVSLPKSDRDKYVD